jgi:DNA polymerase III epsilon subunit-like protein
MIVLVFDTETTGLPKNYKGSLYDSDNWPHIVQLSYIVFDCDKNTILHKINHFIQLPKDIIIPETATAIHHITNEMCATQGINITVALNEFNFYAKLATKLVAHNITFDKRIIIVESIRNNILSIFTSTPKLYCTMKSTIDECKLTRKFKDGTSYFKYPTLTELHEHLFQTKPKGVHDAFNDVLICLRCYYFLEYNKDLITTNDLFKRVL